MVMVNSHEAMIWLKKMLTETILQKYVYILVASLDLMYLRQFDRTNMEQCP